MNRNRFSIETAQTVSLNQFLPMILYFPTQVSADFPTAFGQFVGQDFGQVFDQDFC